MTINECRFKRKNKCHSCSFTLDHFRYIVFYLIKIEKKHHFYFYFRTPRRSAPTYFINLRILKASILDEKEHLKKKERNKCARRRSKGTNNTIQSNQYTYNL